MIEDLFRRMRDRYFAQHIASKPQEREWESESDEAEREQSNAELKEEYDLQTEAFIKTGGNCVYELFPLCMSDIIKHQVD